ncbi:amidohydrolase family protein [Natrialbaceae archaeon A-CW1-1]
MVERIDGYAHIMPQSFLKAMGDVQSGQELRTLENAPHLWDVQKRLSDLDQFGIDKQVIMLARPPIWQQVNPEVGRQLVKRANNEVWRITADNPDRFIPVATLPFGGEQSVAEFDRCITDLGMAGVQIYPNIDGKPIESDIYDPIFKRANDLNVPIWIHPQLHDWYDWIDEYMEHKMLGWPFDTSVTLSRMIFTGVFDTYPDLNIVAHHMGGMIPFFGERIISFYETRKQYPEIYPDTDLSHLSRPIESYFDQIYVDTAISASSVAFRCGLDFFGSENMVFGVDYPFGPNAGRQWTANTTDLIDKLDLDQQAEQNIYSENLKKLLN